MMRTRASEEVSFASILQTATSLKYNMNVIDSTMAKLGIITNDYVPNVAHCYVRRFLSKSEHRVSE